MSDRSIWVMASVIGAVSLSFIWITAWNAYRKGLHFYFVMICCVPVIAPVVAFWALLTRKQHQSTSSRHQLWKYLLSGTIATVFIAIIYIWLPLTFFSARSHFRRQELFEVILHQEVVKLKNHDEIGFPVTPKVMTVGSQSTNLMALDRDRYCVLLRGSKKSVYIVVRATYGNGRWVISEISTSSEEAGLPIMKE